MVCEEGLDGMFANRSLEQQRRGLVRNIFHSVVNGVAQVSAGYNYFVHRD